MDKRHPRVLLGMELRAVMEMSRRSASLVCQFAKDVSFLSDAAYNGGADTDFAHFCGKGCPKGQACHNVGPPGLSKSLAQHGVCQFCFNANRHSCH